MKARASRKLKKNGKPNPRPPKLAANFETRFIFLGTKVLDEIKILARLATEVKR